MVHRYANHKTQKHITKNKKSQNNDVAPTSKHNKAGISYQ